MDDINVLGSRYGNTPWNGRGSSHGGSSFFHYIQDRIPASPTTRLQFSMFSFHPLALAPYRLPTHTTSFASYTQDGYLLGRLLSHPFTTRSTIAHALTIYESIRKPFSNHIVNVAHELGKLYEFVGVDVDADAHKFNGVEEELRRTSASGNTICEMERLPGWVKGWGESVNEAWKWQWEADAPERDFERAVGMLRSAIVRAGA